MFQESEKECGFEGFTLNPSVLKIAIESYYQDIRRVKDYHLIVNKDKFKQAAYTIKWICKLRPFGFDRAVSEVKRHHLLVNEAMAWRAALVFLEIDPRDVDKDLFEHLLYSTYYRVGG